MGPLALDGCKSVRPLLRQYYAILWPQPIYTTKQADITQSDFDSGHKYVLVPHTDGPRVFLTTPNNNNAGRASEFRMGIVLPLHGRGQAI